MFLINKKNVFIEKKMSSDSENLIALVLINNICHTKNKNKKIRKKSKRPKLSQWKYHHNDKSTYVNILLELLLTEKEEFCCYFRMNTTSYHALITRSYIDWLLHSILIFKIHYSIHFSFLQITSSLLRN